MAIESGDEGVSYSGSDRSEPSQMEVYRQSVERQRTAEYVAAIDAAIEAYPELSGLHTGVKSIVTITVDAANKAEADDIYHLLRVYSEQEREAAADSVVIVGIAASGSDLPFAESRTAYVKAEIERARKDFSTLNVATVETESTNTADLESTVRDTALLSVERAVRENRLNSGNDVLVILNKPGTVAMSRSYLRRFHEEAEKHSGTEIFQSSVIQDVSQAKEHPAAVLANKVSAMARAIELNRESVPSPEQGSIGVRASALAGGILSLTKAEFRQRSLARYVVGATIERKEDNGGAATNDDIRINPARGVEELRSMLEASLAGMSESAARSTLTAIFVRLKQGSKAGYSLTDNEDGTFALEFTEEGRKYIANRLKRDHKGRFDTIYGRNVRNFRGRVNNGSKRAPRTPAPHIEVAPSGE